VTWDEIQCRETYLSLGVILIILKTFFVTGINSLSNSQGMLLLLHDHIRQQIHTFYMLQSRIDIKQFSMLHELFCAISIKHTSTCNYL